MYFRIKKKNIKQKQYNSNLELKKNLTRAIQLNKDTKVKLKLLNSWSNNKNFSQVNFNYSCFFSKHSKSFHSQYSLSRWFLKSFINKGWISGISKTSGF